MCTHFFTAMNLLLLLVTVFATSAVFGLSEEGDFWENTVGPQTTDEKPVGDGFTESSNKSGSATHGTSGDYRPIQKKPSNDNVLAKSFLDRIVGGTNAKPGEIPWQARLKIEGKICGAVILDQFWLLSAAHCFHGKRGPFYVTVGDYNHYTKDVGEQTFEVRHVRNHRYYHVISSDNDITLIRINPLSDGRGISFNQFVQPIGLPDSTMSLRAGTPLLVSGWGGLLKCNDCPNEHQTFPYVLQKAVVPIIDLDSCRRMNYPYTVTDRMFCAGYPDGRADSCPGDSGGPIVYRAGGSNVLYGIVSWGPGCGQPNKPGVYTRVTSFVDWIQTTMQSVV